MIDIDEKREELRAFLKTPGMYTIGDDFEAVSAYVCGFDHALGQVILSGFTTWLTAKYEVNSPQGWQGYILGICLDKNMTESAQQVEFLIANVSEFLEAP